MPCNINVFCCIIGLQQDENAGKEMGEIQPSTEQHEPPPPPPPPVTSPQATVQGIPMAPEIEQFALQVCTLQ